MTPGNMNVCGGWGGGLPGLEALNLALGLAHTLFPGISQLVLNPRTRTWPEASLERQVTLGATVTASPLASGWAHLGGRGEGGWWTAERVPHLSRAATTGSRHMREWDLLKSRLCRQMA